MNYRDKFYQKYASTHVSNIYGDIGLDEIKSQFPVWKIVFGKFLPENKNLKIIDLGCGNGGFVYWLHQRGYAESEGIDVSEEQIEIARKLGINNVSKADIKGFISDKNDAYNLIFMRDVLEHFDKNEILDILELVFKSLKDNGKIIIQVPNAESIFSGRIRYGDFTHELSFTQSSMRQILSVSGFRNITVYGAYPPVHGIKSLLRFVLWKIINIFLSAYILVETGSGRGIFTQNLVVIAKK